jgi:hypothetical protein
MRFLGSVVVPPPHLTVIAATEVLQRRAIGSQPIGDDHVRTSMSLHRFLEEFQCGRAITGLRGVAFQHFAFVIHGPPKVV